MQLLCMSLIQEYETKNENNNNSKFPLQNTSLLQNQSFFHYSAQFISKVQEFREGVALTIQEQFLNSDKTASRENLKRKRPIVYFRDFIFFFFYTITNKHSVLLHVQYLHPKQSLRPHNHYRLYGSSQICSNSCNIQTRKTEQLKVLT